MVFARARVCVAKKINQSPCPVSTLLGSTASVDGGLVELPSGPRPNAKPLLRDFPGLHSSTSKLNGPTGHPFRQNADMLSSET